ncbi:DNA-binding response regulator [Acrocarpospora corrugata]|uniref:DNA-binding response regulator n=1 Tax=Acrocarpospora corrugata TaxID=35763 RepID=A0A5M3W3W5_9ACTN|nr:response regulator transcription factor [Acrocarpospora corrugata]GES02702.1 DNA-binding response regulator [Acrocarpospora corrugata]
MPGITPVATAATGREAIRGAVTHRPHVLVLDIQMPDLTGIEAAREISRVAPLTAIVMLTMFEDDDSLFGAIRAGARGSVLKGAAPERIIHAIHAVAAGEAVFGPGIARRILAFLSTAPEQHVESFAHLTPREREILTLIAQGLGNHAIADRLRLNTKTISNHLSAIYPKLGVADRTQAILRAKDAGLA